MSRPSLYAAAYEGELARGEYKGVSWRAWRHNNGSGPFHFEVDGVKTPSQLYDKDPAEQFVIAACEAIRKERDVALLGTADVEDAELLARFEEALSFVSPQRTGFRGSVQALWGAVQSRMHAISQRGLGLQVRLNDLERELDAQRTATKKLKDEVGHLRTRLAAVADGKSPGSTGYGR